MRLIVSATCAPLVVAISVPALAQSVTLFVDDSAPASGTGLSWASPLNDLQSALDLAAVPSNRVSQIKVGQGIYKPTKRIDQADPRSVTFQLQDDLAIVGGFAGYGARNPEARDVDLFPTILTGDLNGDDLANFVNYGENAYHVVIAQGVRDSAWLDGFIIEHGYGCCGFAQFDRRAYGGGLYLNAADAMILNCTFRQCLANQGGGTFSEVGDPTFIACDFVQNKASGINRTGGGLFVDHGHSTLRDCNFDQNWAGDFGGGMAQVFGTATLTGCNFTENQTAYRFSGKGGGFLISGATLQTQGCVFTANLSQGFGGGIRAQFMEQATIEDCLFLGNVVSEGHGGGMSISSGPSTIRNCSFLKNVASSFGLGDGGGLALGTGPTNISACSFEHNIAAASGGGMIVSDATAATFVSGCQFIDNRASFTGGGAIYMSHSDVRVWNCAFKMNRAPDGGAVYIGPGSPTLGNCLFTGNVAINTPGGGRGGGIYARANNPLDCTFTVVNCTMATNSSVSGGALFNGLSVGSVVSNCIAWANTPNQVVSQSAVYPLTVRYCNVQGGWSGAGDHNISTDPNFSNPAIGDYSLLAGSPCADAGDNFAVPVRITTDLAGNPRFVDDPNAPNSGAGNGPLVDLGPLERQVVVNPVCPADCAPPHNGTVDVDDLLVLINHWGKNSGPADIDGNGVVNVYDLLILLTSWGPCPVI